MRKVHEGHIQIHDAHSTKSPFHFYFYTFQKLRYEAILHATTNISQSV